MHWASGWAGIIITCENNHILGRTLKKWKGVFSQRDGQRSWAQRMEPRQPKCRRGCDSGGPYVQDGDPRRGQSEEGILTGGSS